jgi:hypothetical protein
LGKSKKPEILLILPVDKLSTTTTLWPLSSSNPLKWLPINPAPPVIRHLIKHTPN